MEHETETSRTFDIATIAALVTGQNTSPTGRHGIQELFEFVTGRTINCCEKNTIAIQAREKCRNAILSQIDELTTIDIPKITDQNYNSEIRKLTTKFGKYLSIKKEIQTCSNMLS